MFENFYLNIQLLSSAAKMPTRATDGDCGLDLYSPRDYRIYPGEDVLIALDIRVEFPKGYALIVKEKSGVATKMKFDVGACVIDSGYRGNCHVHLFDNRPALEGLDFSGYATHIKKHQKIAQMIVVPVWIGQPIQVRQVDMDTERGEGGFGSEVGYKNKGEK